MTNMQYWTLAGLFMIAIGPLVGLLTYQLTGEQKRFCVLSASVMGLLMGGAMIAYMWAVMPMYGIDRNESAFNSEMVK